MDPALTTWQFETAHHTLEGAPRHEFTNIVFNTIPITYMPITLPNTKLKNNHFN